MSRYPQRVWRLMPLAMLALAVQLILPAGLLRVVAAGADPLGHTTICRVTPVDADDSGSRDSTPAPSHCPLCQLAATNGPTLLPVTSVLPPPAATAPTRFSDPAQSAGPRGPPFWRPGARAPPRIS